MGIPPEREVMDDRLNMALPATLKAEIETYAAENNVKIPVAVRHILRSFLSGYFGKTKEYRAKNKTSALKASE